MKLGLALGAVVLATTVTAYAHTDGGRHFVFHRGGEHQSPDANGDGWITREEAAAHADYMFDQLDRDNNGRLDDADHEALRREIDTHVERAMERVRIDLDGVDEDIRARLAHLDGENCTRSSETQDGERRVTVICRAEAAPDAGNRERRSDRRVRVLRRGEGGNVSAAPIPPAPPVPHAPMLMWGGDEEADLNGDGWLSREEFRAQQLRHFDARDANGDGRVRHRPPPAPPVAPRAPEPPRQP
jgi:hypothetical protein